MASSYTDKLRLTLPLQGELDGSWGNTVNTGITQLIEDALAGTAAVVHDDTASYTLTSNSGATDEARCMFLTVTGTLTAARNLVCPTKSKLYFIINSTTGGYALTLKTAAGTGISIANGDRRMLMCDGTNVIEPQSTLPVTAGGTGRATSTTAYGLLAAGTTATGAQQTLAAGATTELLVGGGAAALPVWTTATGSGSPVRATSPTLVTPALGTPSALVGTNITGTAASLTAGQATAGLGLKSATTTVSVSSATAPSSGQILTATSSTTATWQAAPVTLAGTEALTNKTYSGTNLSVKDTVYTITDGAAFEINPANGGIQKVTLGANRTPKGTNFASGQSVTLKIADGAGYTITWTDGTLNPTWVYGIVPTLATTGYSIVVLWKDGDGLYGKYMGDVA